MAVDVGHMHNYCINIIKICTIYKFIVTVIFSPAKSKNTLDIF